MKKILIVGGNSNINEVINKISDAHEGIEIVVTKGTIIPLAEPIIITARPIVEEIFIAKAKHTPKGHKRPYKYHR